MAEHLGTGATLSVRLIYCTLLHIQAKYIETTKLKYSVLCCDSAAHNSQHVAAPVVHILSMTVV
jgi:hypothetical protein